MKQSIWWKILQFVIVIALITCLILIAKMFGELGELWMRYQEIKEILVDILFQLTNQGVNV